MRTDQKRGEVEAPRLIPFFGQVAALTRRARLTYALPLSSPRQVHTDTYEK